MIKILAKFFQKKTEKDYRSLFTAAGKEDLKKVLLRASRKATQDQQEVLKKYDRMFPNGHNDANLK